MMADNQIQLLITLAVMIIAVLVAYNWSKIKALGKRKILLISAHPLLACILFWSLAWHMHSHFDGWPQSIGDDGFPVALKYHADAASLVIGSVGLLAVFVVPFLALLFSLAPKLRPLLNHLLVYGMGFVLLLASLWMAPDGYADWFLD
jgi:hypothetical protein